MKAIAPISAMPAPRTLAFGTLGGEYDVTSPRIDTASMLAWSVAC